MLLDEEQFKLVEGNYGSVQVPLITGNAQKQMLQADEGGEIEIKRNGYLYIFVSNESQGTVYFDDLRVEHLRGSLLEETHYYPFGLTMKNISSRALMAGPKNRLGFGSKDKQAEEFSDGSGLEMYDFSARTYDPQIDVFRQGDPHSSNYYSWSPYNYCANNPLAITDPIGKDWFQDNQGNVLWNNSKDKTFEVDGVTYSNIDQRRWEIANDSNKWNIPQYDDVHWNTW